MSPMKILMLHEIKIIKNASFVVYGLIFTFYLFL